ARKYAAAMAAAIGGTILAAPTPVNAAKAPLAQALPVREAGFSLLDKGRHALLLVGQSVLRMEEAALEADALGERGLVGAVDRLLRHHGDRERHGCNRLGDLHGFGLQVGERHNARDEPDALGFLRAHVAAGEDHVHGLRLADLAHEALRAAGTRHDAELDLGLAELGVV